MAERPVATAGKRNGNVLQDAFTVGGSAVAAAACKLLIAVPLAEGPSSYCPPPSLPGLPAEG
jgi:hypothetical protein